jgi:hypothetical protein
VNDAPIRLRPEDSPAPRDRDEIGVELAALLRAHADEARHLRDLFVRGGADLIDVNRRAQSRAHELAEMAERIARGFEEYRKSERLAGLFSAGYGGTHGR